MTFPNSLPLRDGAEPRFACVAGGTSGLGRSIVLALRAQGFRVLAVGRGAPHAREFEAVLAGDVLQPLILVGDLRRPDFAFEVASIVGTEFGRLDLLVNSAGTISRGGIASETFADWERVLTTNLHPAFLLTQMCLPWLLKGVGPSVVNISSICGRRPCSSLSYSVSKAGLEMFTRSLARELAPQGIRINAVSPGDVRTNLQLSADLFGSQEEYEEWIASMKPRYPLGRLGEGHDVAAAVLFLASQQASWITGAVVPVDGGLSAT